MAFKETVAVRRCKADYLDTIKVLVGETELEFTVHEEVIVRSSRFFHAACTGDFKEAQDKIIRLPELGEGAFKSYLHSAYSGEVSVMTSEEVAADSEGQECMEKTVELYIAGDVLDDQQLRNACIDSILEISSGLRYMVPGAEVVSAAYSATTDQSPLRKMLVDQYMTLQQANLSWFQRVKHDLPREFLEDFIHAKIMMFDKTLPPEYGREKCKYHEHSTGVPKTAKCMKS